MTLPVYYQYPFGVEGDLGVVPNESASAVPAGAISYQDGYTLPYQIQLGEPDALPINRAQMNRLFYDICSNIQQYQLQGTAPWHPASDNGGVAIEYPLYARVVYNGLVYESQEAANVDTPGAGSSWRVVSGSSVIPGTIIDYAGSTIPDGYLNCDGSQVSQATYSALYAAIGTTWGADGGGLFTLPDLEGYVTAGSGGDLFSGTDAVGDEGGDKDTDQLVSHTHTATITSGTTTTGIDGSSVVISNVAGTPHGSSIVNGSTGTGSRATIVQPTKITMKLIKY